MPRWTGTVKRICLFLILVHNAAGLIISALPRGKDGTDIPNLRLCKPNLADWQVKQIQEGDVRDDPGLSLVDPRDRQCPSGSPGWWWDFAPRLKTVHGDTLIQLRGSHKEEAIGGITNSFEPAEKLHYGVVIPGKIFESEFRVKRNGEYMRFNENDPDDFIKVGDYLEFWGPSLPEHRQLYLKSVFQRQLSSGIYQLVREPIEIYTYGPQPPIELRVVDLGYEEIVQPYSKYEYEDIQEDVKLIDTVTKLRNPKPRFSFCGVGEICTAAARGLGRLLGGRRKQGPTIEIPGLNMDDKVIDGTTDALDSHRRFPLESRPVSRETSGFTPRDESDPSIGEELFEPRIASRPQYTIFTKTKLKSAEVDDILEQITEDPNLEDFTSLYTLGGGGGGETGTSNVNDNVSSDGVEEDIPEELPVAVSENRSIGTADDFQTPQFRTDELLIDTKQPQQGGDVKMQVPQTQGGGDETKKPTQNSRRIVEPPPVRLQKASIARTNQADRYYTVYARCVQRLLTFPNGEPDVEVQNLIDSGKGFYSILDFYKAMEEGKPAPRCPSSRQDIINMAADQGARYIAPGATGANPQSGVAAFGMNT